MDKAKARENEYDEWCNKCANKEVSPLEKPCLTCRSSRPSGYKESGVKVTPVDVYFGDNRYLSKALDEMETIFGRKNVKNFIYFAIWLNNRLAYDIPIKKIDAENFTKEYTRFK